MDTERLRLSVDQLWRETDPSIFPASTTPHYQGICIG